MKFTHRETAEFLMAESAELAKLAGDASLEALVFIFEMAELEARNELNTILPPK